jgi:hypothetical protein
MLPTNPLLNATAPAGPHLPVTLLRQYAAGALAPAAQHRVEAHTLACPRCADILAGLLQTPAATTDQALAQLQQRLRQRVQQAAPARQVAAPRRHRWLAPQLAAAAALLLGLVAGGWWTWQQRQHPLAASTTVAAGPKRSVAQPPALPAPAGTLATSVDTVKGAAEAFGRSLSKAKGSQAVAAATARPSQRYMARPRVAASQATPVAPATSPAPVVASPPALAGSTALDTAAPATARQAAAGAPPHRARGAAPPPAASSSTRPGP